MTDTVVLDTIEGVGKDVKAALPPPPLLSSQVAHLFTSQTWTAPSDGWVRVCVSSGGGGYGGGTGTAYGGGASALAFWAWRKIVKGQTITFTLGAGGTTAAGGTSTVTAPWGSMTASPGGVGSVNTGANGGVSGTGADYYYPGGSNISDKGGALNPFNLPVATVSGNGGIKTSPPGWLAAINGQGIGNGGVNGGAAAGFGGGGSGGTGVAGGNGLGILEFSASVA